MTVATEQEQVLHELRQADKLLLTTHENPDGDALGSLLAMHRLLEQLGKDSLDVHVAGRVPAAVRVPRLLVRRPGRRAARTTSTSARSCSSTAATSTACRSTSSRRDGLHILNIDHHHDNTRFGTVNLVAAEAPRARRRSSGGCSKELGVEITPGIADALYVGLVTDTGRFMYENTSAAAHRMAAELIEAGVEPHQVYRRLYEDLPFRRLQLLARALASVERYDDGAITMAHLTQRDFEETGALETDSEGVVDHMRAVEGTRWRRSCASCSATTATASAR